MGGETKRWIQGGWMRFARGRERRRDAYFRHEEDFTFSHEITLSEWRRIYEPGDGSRGRRG